MSASKSRKVATDWLDGIDKNCLFLIESRTGRYIAPLSHYGPNSPDPAHVGNEEEVLFAPNTTFNVLAVDYVSGPAIATAYYEVVLEEL